MSLRVLACCALLLASTWRPAVACSLRPLYEFPAGFVLYGEVVAHVEGTYLSRPAWGIRIAPRYEFRIPGRTTDGTYEVFPLNLKPDCTPSVANTPEKLAEFPIGATVRVVGESPRNTPIPGDIYVPAALGVLSPVGPQCDVAVLAEAAHVYRSPGRPPDACTDETFELNKDIALLETRAAKRTEILERLAAYWGPVSYLDLLAKYAPDAETRKRLLTARYGDVVGMPCGTRPPDLDPADQEGWLLLMRREELCGQRHLYEPETSIDRDIYDAIVAGRLDRIQAFLRDGGDPNRPLRVDDGWHPLKVAIYADHEAIALALLEAGADFEQSGATYAVVQHGMDRVLDFLLTQDPNRLRSPELGLGGACSRGHYDIVDVATRHARDNSVDLGVVAPNAFNDCLYASPDAFRLAHERGVAFTDTALRVAARSSSLDMVRYLLAQGADPFARYVEGPRDADYGTAAIDVALVEYEYKDDDAKPRARYVIHELLAVGPPPKSGSKLEGMAQDAMQEIRPLEDPSDRLVAAARLGLYDVVQQLLAVADASPSTLAAATDAALRARYPDIARLLLAAGAEPGGGALHTAAQTGPVGIVRHLIALGADVDERVGGLTPIESWYAGKREYRDAPVLKALLDAGADGCPLLAKLPPYSEGRSVLLRARPNCAQ